MIEEEVILTNSDETASLTVSRGAPYDENSESDHRLA